MMAVKKRERQRWWNFTIERNITAEMRSDMVDILVKANADLNTREHVR